MARALAGKPDVSSETKARIEKVAAELKYRPNYIARSLSLGKSRLIGIVASPLVFPTFQSIILTVQHSLQKSGYGILHYTGLDAGLDGQEHCLEHMIQNRVEAVLAVPGPSASDANAYRELIDAGTKLVVIDGFVEGIDAPQVVPDNYKAGRLGIQHLVSLGHRNIVYLGMPPTSFIGSERLRGVKDAMVDAGISASAENIFEIDCTEDAAAEAMATLLGRSDRPSAVFTRHDIVARGAMRAIFNAGLSIPKDISLVGCGDMQDNDILRVPLTTVRLPGDQAIAMGISRLVKMLKGGHVKPETTILNVELVVRSSTAPPSM